MGTWVLRLVRRRRHGKKGGWVELVGRSNGGAPEEDEGEDRVGVRGGRRAAEEPPREACGARGGKAGAGLVGGALFHRRRPRDAGDRAAGAARSTGAETAAPGGEVRSRRRLAGRRGQGPAERRPGAPSRLPPSCGGNAPPKKVQRSMMGEMISWTNHPSLPSIGVPNPCGRSGPRGFWRLWSRR